MAKIVAADPTQPAIQTALGAHNYRLVGLEITAPPGATLGYSLVTLGRWVKRAETRCSKMAHDLVLDRVYVHGTPTLDFQRCIALNSGSTAIVDSYISECHAKGHRQPSDCAAGMAPARTESRMTISKAPART